ncbi:MAG: RNA polymerase sigma factor [Caldilineaceae bacterium]
MEIEAILAPDIEDDLTDLVVELFHQHGTAVCAYVQCLVRDWELAHDLTQDVFLQLYRTRARLAHVENPRAWVYRIASHVAFNELKRRRRFHWLPWRHADQQAPLTWIEHDENVERRVILEQMLNELPPDYRAPLLLYSSYGLSVREVAQALEISEGAVKTRLHRARAMFREIFERAEPLENWGSADNEA